MRRDPDRFCPAERALLWLWQLELDLTIPVIVSVCNLPPVRFA
jgi:hypothetical protein